MKAILDESFTSYVITPQPETIEETATFIRKGLNSTGDTDVNVFIYPGELSALCFIPKQKMARTIASIAAGTLVHAACEDEECRRAHAMLSPKERDAFLRMLQN